MLGIKRNGANLAIFFYKMHLAVGVDKLIIAKMKGVRAKKRDIFYNAKRLQKNVCEFYRAKIARSVGVKDVTDSAIRRIRRI